VNDHPAAVGSRVCLRPLGRAHLARTLAWVNDPELMRLLDRARPVAPDEHERWYEELSTRNDRQYFAIETIADRRHIGNVWLWDIDGRHRRAEVRVLIGDATGTDRGLGTEALDLISRYAFDQRDMHKVYAYVLSINPRAKRAFEKAGFAPEGLLRADRRAGDRYVDVHLLARLREEPL
jgi:RimJ/RimL family protein N-acetyltransferase